MSTEALRPTAWDVLYGVREVVPITCFLLEGEVWLRRGEQARLGGSLATGAEAETLRVRLRAAGFTRVSAAVLK